MNNLLTSAKERGPRTILISLFALLLFSQAGFSQEVSSIVGTITSKETGEPLGGITVLLVETNQRSITDVKGNYRLLKVPVGTYTLQINNLIYTEKKVVIVLGERDFLRIDFELLDTPISLDEVIVKGRNTNLIGRAGSASEGSTSQLQLEKRPISRTGEVMETIPGLIVSQHSGSGKANQYYMRGLNLDHGTDFAASIEGMPLNLPTHAHGQGYLDVNFLIPELIKEIDFEKGPYYADAGDFSSAGNSKIQLADKLDKGIIKAEIGQYNEYRGLIANSASFDGKSLLYGLDYSYSKGPWTNPENANRFSGIVKFFGGNRTKGYTLTALGYYNKWNSTDQIPERAVAEGLISRLGTIDPSDGGKTSRYSLVGNWWKNKENGANTKISAYAAYYGLNLFSNFTYYLEQPVKGDQFEQADRRFYGGAAISHSWIANWLGKKMTNEIGAQIRHDQIFEVGLYNTQQQNRYETTSDDQVGESNGGLYFSNSIEWLEKIKTTIGIRGDVYHFNVDSGLEVNSGKNSAFIASPKFRLAIGPWYNTEFYIDMGLGYHSNDARGTTIQVDPSTGERIDQVDPLVRSRGAEIGIRSSVLKGLRSTLSFWYLGLDSELVFIGDAGGTEASDASTHFGLEWTNYYRPLDWLTLDLDLSLDHSRFVHVPSAVNKIPNSISETIKAGFTVNITPYWYAGLRFRYFGPQPLTESGDIESASTRILNFRTEYRLRDVKLALDVLNILDSQDPDISYYYTSRLQGETLEGINDIHFHPVLPITARVSITYQF